MRIRASLGFFALALGLLAAGCATGPSGGTAPAPPPEFAFLNRITWGAKASDDAAYKRLGPARYLEAQLHPEGDGMPAAIDASIHAMRISQTPLEVLIPELEAQRKAADALTDPDQKKTAQQAYQQALQSLGREAATRSLERDLYSSNQLEEQLTWFWMNHFNVNQNKANLRAMIGDYEEHAIRVHALGHFRDLVKATLMHPAMLRYLDNQDNAANHINENYARELMELHTMGVNSGYSQKDVQELARILTGLGVNFNPNAPLPTKGPLPQRFGLTEFNPARHDMGDKMLLGHAIKGRGLGEVDEAVDLLARQPATARFISRKLAIYFVADEPSDALVEEMAQTFRATDGDIRAVLETLFNAPDFARSLDDKFKDPIHFVVSALRLSYGDRPIANGQPILNWLNRMGEPWASHDTPDGYALTASAWNSPGQLTTRFEVAKNIASGPAGLFKSEGDNAVEQPAFPQPANAFYYAAIESTLKGPTRTALAQATSPQEWNTFLFSSPEFSER